MRMGRRQVYEVGSVGCFVSGLGEGVSVLARDFGLAVVFFLGGPRLGSTRRGERSWLQARWLESPMR